MIAMMEKTTVDSVTELLPTVTYDPVNQVITATVIVGFDTTTSSLVVHAPLIAVPKGVESSSWTALWNVAPDATLQSASFRSTSEGVEIPGQNLPPEVTLLALGPVPSPSPQSPDQWQATFGNAVTGPNSFNYILSVKGTPLGSTLAMCKRHDPTIVVTPDPMGG